MKNIYSRFEESAFLYANKKAIVSHDDSITYLDLNQKVIETALYYEQMGFHNGDVVCFICDNSIDYIVCYLAACKNGVCFIPIDSRLTSEEIFRISGIIKPTAIICEKKFSDTGYQILTKNYTREIIKEDKIIFRSNMDIFYYIEKVPRHSGLSDDDFTVLFSSGTTGGPKGVIFSQEIIINQISIYARYFKMNESDRVLCPVTLVHSYGIFDHALSALMIGATLYLPNITLMNPRLILDIIHDEKITFFGTLPYMYDMMASIRTKKTYDFSSVRYMICGGAPLLEETVEKFESKFGRRINQVYGLTEVGYVSFNSEVKDPMSIGKVFNELEVKIVDADGNECSEGEAGELAIKIDYMVARGYLDNSEEEKVMYKDGWFFTKDIVRIDPEGCLYYSGRISEFINVGGNKLTSSDIERVINSTDGVKESVVVAVNNKVGHQEIFAVVIPEGLQDLKALENEITHNCIKKLAAFKRPSRIKFMDTLPKTPLGKVRRGELIDILSKENTDK